MFIATARPSIILHSMGMSLKFFCRCTSSGVSIYCVSITVIVPFLSFLQVSKISIVVLQCFANIVIVCQTVMNSDSGAPLPPVKLESYCDYTLLYAVTKAET
ncbi:hypothetical protein F5146DRAFT_1011700 [Armillaria mellea]|nr:hypothetical protein F5146DRAFT_1011700 [Armillaria mellea]